jgi:hypothetical protein
MLQRKANRTVEMATDGLKCSGCKKEIALAELCVKDRRHKVTVKKDAKGKVTERIRKPQLPTIYYHRECYAGR